MICKFCGEPIDKNTMQCTRCGEPAGSLTGGVGFWDLAGARAPVSAQPVPQAGTAKIGKSIDRLLSRQEHMDKKIMLLSCIVAGMLILSIILDFILIGVTLNLGKKYDTLSGQIQNYLEQGNADTQQEDLDPDKDDKNPEQEAVQTEPVETENVPDEDELTEETEQGTVVENTEEVTPEPTGVSFIVITKQPVTVSVSNRVAIGAKLFSLRVKGEGLQFRWEKYNAETDAWTAVDAKLFETVNNASNTESTLTLKYKSDEIYGEYRCVITDAYGKSIESNVVEIYDPNLQGVG